MLSSYLQHPSPFLKNRPGREFHLANQLAALLVVGMYAFEIFGDFASLFLSF